MAEWRQADDVEGLDDKVKRYIGELNASANRIDDRASIKHRVVDGEHPLEIMLEVMAPAVRPDFRTLVWAVTIDYIKGLDGAEVGPIARLDAAMSYLGLTGAD